MYLIFFFLLQVYIHILHIKTVLWKHFFIYINVWYKKKLYLSQLEFVVFNMYFSVRQKRTVKYTK